MIVPNFPDQKFELKINVTVANGSKTCSEIWSCQDRDNFRTKSSSSKWTCLRQMAKKVGQCLGPSRSWHLHDPKMQAQNGRVCGKWPKKLVKIWDRYDHDISTTPKSELKMDVSAANGQKSWSIFGTVTIMTFPWPQNPSSKWTCLRQMTKKVGQILDPLRFRYRISVTSDKKSRPVRKLFQLKRRSYS